MLKELLHPLVVLGFLEKSQELKFGAGKVAVHLGAAPVGGNARGVVPSSVTAIVKLVFADPPASIVGINVLYEKRADSVRYVVVQ